MVNFENLDKFAFCGVGKYGIPQIEPERACPQGDFIPVNYANSTKDFVKGFPQKGIATMFKPANGQKYYERKRKNEE